VGSGQTPVKKYNEYLRDLIVNGKVKPSQIVSHRIQIEPVPDAYKKFDQRIEGYTKVLIKFDQQKAA
jgi:glutathione-independent formaldehyde dehydrogenase